MLIGVKVGSNVVPSIPQNVSFIRNGNNFILFWDAVPEADWYAVYASFDAYNDFSYAGWYDSSITQLTGPFNPDLGRKLFFRITAGTGVPPIRERTSDDRLLMIDFKPKQ